MFIFANDLPPINPLDDGVKTRARCVSYDKQFVVADSDTQLEHNQERADVNFEDKIQTTEWRDAFLHLILEAYEHKPLAVPEGVTKSFDTWTQGYTFADQFKDKFKVVLDKPEAFICNDYFTQWRKQQDIQMSPKKFANEMSKLGLTSGKSKGKRGFHGVEIRMDEDDL